MRYVRQFGIILLISFLGEALRALLGLPVPASIYGLVLMLGALKSGILRLEQVKDASTFLIEAMPVMFIPAAVGLMASWPVLKPVLAPMLTITALTTCIVMAVTGRAAQHILTNRKGGRHE